MGEPQPIPLDMEVASDSPAYEAWRSELNRRVGEFADEHNLTFGMMALLLVDLGISARMIEYLVVTAKPSGMGLKLDLDRFRREIDDYIRSCKRDADDFVRSSKDAVARALEALAASDEGQSA